MGNSDLVKDLGILVPNKTYNFTVLLDKDVKQVQTNCGCISMKMSKNPQILEGTFTTDKEFPFQIKGGKLTKIQLVNITYKDGEASILKVTGKLINPDLKHESN